MEEMNQSAPMSQPAATAAPAASTDTKKTSMSMILILVVVAAVVALLILSKTKDMDDAFVEQQGAPVTTGEVQPVTNTSDELDALESDINSLNLDDIDAGL